MTDEARPLVGDRVRITRKGHHHMTHYAGTEGVILHDFGKFWLMQPSRLVLATIAQPKAAAKPMSVFPDDIEVIARATADARKPAPTEPPSPQPTPSQRPKSESPPSPPTSSYPSARKYWSELTASQQGLLFQAEKTEQAPTPQPPDDERRYYAQTADGVLHSFETQWRRSEWMRRRPPGTCKSVRANGHGKAILRKARERGTTVHHPGRQRTADNNGAGY